MPRMKGYSRRGLGIGEQVFVFVRIRCETHFD